MARKVDIVTTSSAVSAELVSSIAVFNDGCYYGTKIRLRKIIGTGLWRGLDMRSIRWAWRASSTQTFGVV
jgi:hypothetical protein